MDPILTRTSYVYEARRKDAKVFAALKECIRLVFNLFERGTTNSTLTLDLYFSFRQKSPFRAQEPRIRTCPKMGHSI